MFVQNVLGLLPGSIGFRLNELLVTLIRGPAHMRLRSKDRILKGLRNMEILARETGFSLEGRNVLEVRTGSIGIDLMVFYLLGAKEITTIDYHRHLSLESISYHVRHFDHPECLSGLSRLGCSEERLGYLRKKCLEVCSLSELLDWLGVKYLILHSSKYGDLPIEPKSIDLFYSESVLQRIPERHLGKLMSLVGNSLMSEDAVFFHRTDQKDINSQEHVDTSLWSLNYLKYGHLFYNCFLSGKFNSQNRLRESDFLVIMEASGMSNLYVESSYRNDDVKKLQTFRVAKRFRNKTLQDLAITASKIIGRKKVKGEPVSLKRKEIST